ncbi:transglutaminase-like cysteine peptidase [Oceanospirillum multiglobuliferum]|uniref:transglutaminase-like cysteine peptidase n=1 Tax=Oceanospirillum multiglobuliferum TaxID=64969 RepID=UPI00135665A5|nr:transglutaminase-like cysteine peptidase [Oceanospirillum multiglobuliferum]
MTPFFAMGQSWQELVDKVQRTELEQQLDLVNRYFNEQVRYRAELNDRWQSLSETLNSKQGDCEDFALGKYQTFLASGSHTKSFSFIYALREPDKVAHIALLHKPSNLLLDSLTNNLSTMNLRQDLSPVIEFTANSYQLFSPEVRLTRAELVSLRGWQKTLKKAEKQSSKELYD